jgi:hypothetical protein
MGNIIMITYLLVFFLTNSIQLKMSAHPITGIHYYSKYELYNVAASDIIREDGYVNIYYYKDLILYEIPVYGAKVIPEKQQIIMLDSVAGHQYFITVKDQDEGYYTTSTNWETSNRVCVDSVLHANGFVADSIIKSNYDQLQGSFLNYKGYSLVEQYVIANKPDDSYPDSNFYYFSASFPVVDFSLNAKMEAEKKSKLVKVQMIYNPTVINQNSKQISVPRREFLFELTPVETAKASEKLQLFESFEQFCKSHSIEL